MNDSIQISLEYNNKTFNSLYLNVKDVIEKILNKEIYTKVSKQLNEKLYVNKTNFDIKQLAKLKNVNNNEKSYYCYLLKNDHIFNGIVSKDFAQHILGFSVFSNNDIYLGQVINGIRQGVGFYKYEKNVLESGKQEYFFGDFKDNKKHKKGVYYWFKDDLNEKSSFETSYFDILIGYIENNEFGFGTLINKTENGTFFYFGGFSSNGKKNDDQGIFYDLNKCKIFIGTIKDDVMKSGFLIDFSNNEKKSFKYNDNENNSSSSSKIYDTPLKKDSNKDNQEKDDLNNSMEYYNNFIKSKEKNENYSNEDSDLDNISNKENKLKSRKILQENTTFLYVELEENQPINIIKDSEISDVIKENKIEYCNKLIEIFNKNEWMKIFYQHFEKLNNYTEKFIQINDNVFKVNETNFKEQFNSCGIEYFNNLEIMKEISTLLTEQIYYKFVILLNELFEEKLDK